MDRIYQTAHSLSTSQLKNVLSNVAQHPMPYLIFKLRHVKLNLLAFKFPNTIPAFFWQKLELGQAGEVGFGRSIVWQL